MRFVLEEVSLSAGLSHWSTFSGAIDGATAGRRRNGTEGHGGPWVVNETEVHGPWVPRFARRGPDVGSNAAMTRDRLIE